MISQRSSKGSGNSGESLDGAIVVDGGQGPKEKAIESGVSRCHSTWRCSSKLLYNIPQTLKLSLPTVVDFMTQK